MKSVKDTISEGYENISSSQAISSLKSNLKSTKKSIFGAYEAISPSDTKPYKVKRNLFLLKTGLSFKGNFYKYDSISSIFYKCEKTTINLATTNIIVLIIIFDNNERISAKSTNLIFEGPKFRSIYNAYSFLSMNTFESRRNKLLRDLEIKGVIERDGVRIFRDSRIQKGMTSIDLRISKKNNCIMMGTSFDLSYKFNYNNPNKIIIGETDTGVLSKRITFNLHSDRDIILPLISILADQSI